MTASGASASADSAPDLSHMCCPVGVGCCKFNRDSVEGFHRHRSSRCKWSSNLYLLLSVLLSLLLSAHSQTTDDSAVDRTALNQQIQQAAFQSFPRRVRTGTVYNATLPGNLSAVVDVQMVRFRTGRLRRYGFQFQQVNLPVGVRVEENLRHVVLVYRGFKDFIFHNVTSGTEFVAPVVGVFVYNGSNLTTLQPLPQLKVSTTLRPVEVTVPSLNIGDGTNLTCVLFNDTGFTTLSNFTSTSSSTCSWNTLGDFALLVPRTTESSGGGSNNAWKIAVGAVAGAIVLLGLLTLIALAAVKYRRKTKFANMERVAEHGETLQHTQVGGGRAPAAASTRTKPTLESDYAS